MKHLSADLLNAYLDGTLDEPERLGAETHLADCAECRTRLQELDLVFASLAALPEEPLERDLAPAILSRLPRSRFGSARPYSVAVQWGIVLGVAIWSAAQLAGLARLPSLGLLLQVAVLELPALSISDLQIPSIHLPQFELASINLPAISLHSTNSQIGLVAGSALLLWVVGNFLLLRQKPQGSD